MEIDREGSGHTHCLLEYGLVSLPRPPQCQGPSPGRGTKVLSLFSLIMGQPTHPKGYKD